jgi:hypothetical protein
MLLTFPLVVDRRATGCNRQFLSHGHAIQWQHVEFDNVACYMLTIVAALRIVKCPDLVVK